VPFPEVARPSRLKLAIPLEPSDIPLPAPDDEENSALGLKVADVAGDQVTVIGGGSEDLIAHDSEEDGGELLFPVESPKLPKLNLGKFAFRV